MGTGGRSSSVLTSIRGGIAPIDSANSVTLLLWLFFSATVDLEGAAPLRLFFGDRTGMWLGFVELVDKDALLDDLGGGLCGVSWSSSRGGSSILCCGKDQPKRER